MIGTGDVTERKSGPAFSKVPGSRLVAVGNRTPSRAEDYARRHGIPAWHADPFDVITDPAVDIVYIATPPGSHTGYALACIETGKPVYIEKPMTRTGAECREINSAAAKAGVKVFVAYYRRSLEYFNRVKELLDSGRLGKPLQVTMVQYFPARPEDMDPANLPWRVVPGISGGGYFHDVGCHALDILFYLFGNPLSVTGTAGNLGGLYDADDTVTALLTLPGNLPAGCSWSFVTPELFAEDRVVVTGERGRLAFSIFSFEPIIFNPVSGEPETFSTIQPEHIQLPCIRSIVDELRGRGSCPSTGLTAEVTSRVMDRVTEFSS